MAHSRPAAVITAADYNEDERERRYKQLIWAWVRASGPIGLIRSPMPDVCSYAPPRLRAYVDQRLLLIRDQLPETIVIALPGRAVSVLVEGEGMTKDAIIVRADNVTMDPNVAVTIVETDVPMNPGIWAWK